MVDPTTPKPRSVYRGSLALLRNVETYEKHPFDVEEMKAAKALLRSKKRQRKQMENQTLPLTVVDKPEDLFSGADFVILFFFHPRQPHSLRLRSAVADFCEKHASKVCCLGLFGGDPKGSTVEEREDAALFLTGTGFLHVPQKAADGEDSVGQDACSSLISFLDVTHIPSIVVVPTSTGRPIVGQEAAIEWNASVQDEKATEAMFQRWRDGSSGLSFSQSLLSKMLGDSSSVCSLM